MSPRDWRDLASGQCPMAGGGGAGRRKKPKCDHDWKWIRRNKPMFGGQIYDEYRCTKCGETKQEPV